MWKKIRTKKLLDHPRLRVYEDVIELPDGTRSDYLWYESGKDSVVLICTDGEKILLQKEFSYPTGKTLYQFPGGGIEEGETAAEAAMRELAEESALAGDVQRLGWFYTDNRRTNKKMYVFQVINSSKVSKVKGDKEEEIDSVWMSVCELNELIEKGKIVNYSLLAALALYQNRKSGV